MSASASRAQVLVSPLPASSLAEVQAGATAPSQLPAAAAAAPQEPAAQKAAPDTSAAPDAPQTAAQAFAAKAPVAATAQDVSAKAATPAVAGRPGTVATTAKPALPTQSPATAGSIGGAVVALVLVVGLILALGWIAKRLPGFRNTAGNGALRVVSSLSLGPRERVVVVAVGETQLLIGVGTGGMRTLHTLEQPLPVAPASATPAFAQLLAQHFGKKS